MNDEINYKNSPLHGIGLKSMLADVVDHYGFEILYAYLNINCFKINPSIASSVKFLKKTDWAREKVEDFYLYQFKNLPRASYEQFQLSPRERIIPDDQTAGEPAELSLEDAKRLQEKKKQKAAAYQPSSKSRSNKHDRYSNNQDNSYARKQEQTSSPTSSSKEGFDPWGKSKKS